MKGIKLWLVVTLLLLLPLIMFTGCMGEEQLQEAYEQGHEAGIAEAYISAYEEGYAVGYGEGFTVGNTEGYTLGCESGLKAGYDEGYAAGYGEGHVEQPVHYREMFYFYYLSLSYDEQQYGVKKLDQALNRQWNEEAYEANVFDCSEMSALLEWYLEREGWNVDIAIGNSPWGSEGKHAWLLVETSEGKWIPVEATQWCIIYPDDPLFKNYFDYIKCFETIREALEYSPTGFDWWVFE